MSNLPVRLGYTAFAPLPDSFFNDPKAFETKPIGAGPFKVDSDLRHRDGAEQVRRLLGQLTSRTSTRSPSGSTTTTSAAYNDVVANNLDYHRRSSRRTGSPATYTRASCRTATARGKPARSAAVYVLPDRPDSSRTTSTAQGHLDGDRPGSDRQADLQRHVTRRSTAGSRRWSTASRPAPAATTASSTRRRRRQLYHRGRWLQGHPDHHRQRRRRPQAVGRGGLQLDQEHARARVRRAR